MIYGVFLVVNVKLIVMWQQRHQVPAETDELEPKVSRFGRPLRAMRRRKETAVPASATAPSVAPVEGA
jgi:hypothetical protein